MQPPKILADITNQDNIWVNNYKYKKRPLMAN